MAEVAVSEGQAGDITMKRPMVILLLTSSVACGGNSGGGSPQPTPSPAATQVVTPAPTVLLSPTTQTVRVGEFFSIEVTSTNTTSCTESSLGNVVSNGYIYEVANSAGRHTFSVTCTGAGGVATEAVTVVVPIPVKPTSYENKMVDVAPAVLPLVELTGGTEGRMAVFSGAQGYADLDQSGSYNWFVIPSSWDSSDPWALSSIHIFRDNAGEWVEVTKDLIEPDENGELPKACMSPRSLIADFNGNGVPDIFLYCSAGAYEYEDGSAVELRLQHPQIVLSQPNGKFSLDTVLLPRPIYAHGATAADINGNGYPDIVLTDQLAPIGEPTVFVLYNNGDGTFTADYSQFQMMSHVQTPWSAEFIPVNGELKLWLAGTDEDAIDYNGFTHSLFSISGNGTFNPDPVATLPTTPGNYEGCQSCFAMPLDIVVHESNAYVLRVNAYYDGYLIQRVDLETMTGEALYEHNGPAFDSDAMNPECRGLGGTTIDSIRIHDGKIVTDFSCTSPDIEIEGWTAPVQ